MAWYHVPRVWATVVILLSLALLVIGAIQGSDSIPDNEYSEQNEAMCSANLVFTLSPDGGKQCSEGEDCRITCAFPATVTAWRSTLQVLATITGGLVVTGDRFRNADAHGTKVKWAAFVLGGLMLSMFSIDADRVQTGNPPHSPTFF